MSDFSELCPIFATGVYNELYLGTCTASIYDATATYNFLSSPGDPATAPASFSFGRTVVVTEVWARRHATATAYTATLCILIGRRTGSGTATISDFGTICISMSSALSTRMPLKWMVCTPTSFTLNSADFLNISLSEVEVDSAEEIEFIVKYREK
jgi:hypothetical protein